jgi:hypothetical protein
VAGRALSGDAALTTGDERQDVLVEALEPADLVAQRPEEDPLHTGRGRADLLHGTEHGFSTLLCTPGSLSQDVGLALGA